MLVWGIFGLGFVGTVAFVVLGLKVSVGKVLLVLAAGSRLSAYIGATVGEIGFLRGIWLEGSKRLAWLEDYVEAVMQHSNVAVPAQLVSGIQFDHISFAYPGTDRLVLDDICLKLKAGSVIAIVGENGAGKTTLVKLLCRLYHPTQGRILVDGSELRHMAVDQWRARLAGAFQDFFRFELKAQHTVGLGDVGELDNQTAVMTAVERADAREIVNGLSSRLETQLGSTWPNGTDLSFGQWQKLALARGFMRNEPLLLILDEPTAALDAETEHALFERYAAAARSTGSDGESATNNGRITILVSHRFSTVRMADVIVVLDGCRLIEVGTHDELVGKAGKYAELYRI
jgi:ATP-binding cassette subfamily B protein